LPPAQARKSLARLGLVGLISRAMLSLWVLIRATTSVASAHLYSNGLWPSGCRRDGSGWRTSQSGSVDPYREHDRMVAVAALAATAEGRTATAAAITVHLSVNQFGREHCSRLFWPPPSDIRSPRSGPRHILILQSVVERPAAVCIQVSRCAAEKTITAAAAFARAPRAAQ